MNGQARRIRCFAKINLGLEVLGAREDGYHDLRTILHTIDLHDTLEVAPAPALSLRMEYAWPEGTGSDLPTDESNLVLKAASAAGARGVRFTLTKRIPAGTGLGGGSSDAAGVLLALAEIEGRRRDPRELHEIAAKVGSDVPFFLYGGAALALGRGDHVYPLPEGPPIHFVLGFGPDPLETSAVYASWDDLLTSTGNICRVNNFAAWSTVRGDDRPFVANDLEEAAIRLRPSLKDLRNTMETTGARSVSMTGSGSAFYGLFEDAPSASEGARRVREAGYVAVTARSVGRQERDLSLWERREEASGRPA